ncbi:MAG: Phosphate-binding protein PstS 1 precursor [Firmicutes bacterium ADurb.Bin193]|nr:MAG: Phosphate-binding protein PstS 1 precursor [Firmicutes bacterium ADurb.Bin193]
MKRSVSLLIALATLTVTAFASDFAYLKINENRALISGEMTFIDLKNPEVVPLIKDGRTLVPVRFVAEAFGYDVYWEEQTRTVTLTDAKSLVTLKIGDTKMTVEKAGAVKAFTLDVPPDLIGERTFLPLRAIAEQALERKVTWYPESGIICITDGGETNYEAVAKQFSPAKFNLKDYPKIDCSTSVIPLVNAINEKILGIGKKTAELVTVSSKTHGAYVNLIEGKCDLIITPAPSEEELALAKAAGAELLLTPICNEAFVFLTHKDNPVNSLTLSQIQDIYSGKIQNWKDVGGADERIIAYQRNANAGSQTIMESVVMKGLTMAKPPSQEVIFGMGELIDAVANYENTSAAIGYSVYYYASEMKKNPDIKLLSVNGVAPSPETIQSKQYPIVISYYAVTLKGRQTDKVKALIEWLTQPEGQNLISDSGYVKK